MMKSMYEQRVVLAAARCFCFMRKFHKITKLMLYEKPKNCPFIPYS